MNNDKFSLFLYEYKKVIKEEPLVKFFLKDPDNYELLKNAVLFPTDENKKKVEDAFSNHQNSIRIQSYFTNLIRYYAIDYDKKTRKGKERYQLTLDKPISKNGEESQTFKDILPDKIDPFKTETNKTLLTEIANEKLYKALDSLTELQYNILELKYVKQLTNIEVANVLNTTPQNISNIHKKALVKLKKYMIG
jgi:RNA polymerase sigma factor (sigma-70 family)